MLVEKTYTNQISDRRQTDRCAQRGEENFGVDRPAFGRKFAISAARS